MVDVCNVLEASQGSNQNNAEISIVIPQAKKPLAADKRYIKTSEMSLKYK